MVRGKSEMARDSLIDADFLKAALIGYQMQRDRMAALIADIQGQLGRRGPGRPKALADTVGAVDAAPAAAGRKRKRKLSAAGRARIVAATKARWEAYRANKGAGK